MDKSILVADWIGCSRLNYAIFAFGVARAPTIIEISRISVELIEDSACSILYKLYFIGTLECRSSQHECEIHGNSFNSAERD